MSGLAESAAMYHMGTPILQHALRAKNAVYSADLCRLLFFSDQHSSQRKLLTTSSSTRQQNQVGAVILSLTLAIYFFVNTTVELASVISISMVLFN